VEVTFFLQSEGCKRTCQTKNILGRRNSKYKGLRQERDGHFCRIERALMCPGNSKLGEGSRRQRAKSGKLSFENKVRSQKV
jgi:hypothetical protein